jgi:repressor LexA
MRASFSQENGMAETKPLTNRQREIFDWIKAFIARNGLPPTVREIGGAFDIKSSSAFELLQALERKGVLRRGNLGARSLVVRGGRGLRRDSVEVRILGRIVAGAPNLAVEDPSETLVVDERLGRGRDLYALRVDGDSMKDADILDGDVVIIRRQDTADDGDIVVALIDDEATLKRFYRDGGGVRLQPANRQMAPIHVRSGEFRIQGRVVGVQRLFDA